MFVREYTVIFHLVRHASNARSKSIHLPEHSPMHYMYSTPPPHMYAASWSLLVEGHFSNVESDGALGEAWGLDPHPTSADIVATCGDDATVRVWSIGAGRLLRKAQLDACCR